MKHLNSLNEDGGVLLDQILEYGTHEPTEKLILAIKSLQNRIFSHDQSWKIEGKKKRKGKLDIDKFRKKFFGEK